MNAIWHPEGFELQTSRISVWHLKRSAQLRYLKNQKLECEKVAQQCSKTKTENGRAKSLNKKIDKHLYNNCLKLRSGAI